MRAAVLNDYGVPGFAEFPTPDVAPDVEAVTVLAAALNGVDVAIASGEHYLSPRSLPVVTGIDGVGRDATGRRVYFTAPPAPYGSMAERAPVRPGSIVEVPDGVPDAVAAALGNAGLAAWLPLSSTGRLAPGESVLVLGATGVVGRLAVQVARLLGAGKVIAAGRDPHALAGLTALGADETIALGEVDDLTAAVRDAGGADVIVDYLWGDQAVTALAAGRRGVRLVHVGDRAGGHASLPGALLRSLNASVSGFMILHVAPDAREDAYRRLCEEAAAGHLDVPVETLPLSRVADAWARYPGARQRFVLVPD